ncbi:hypothetical protein PVK06_031074 [Gossypium arboreum]|uniref:Uncharacterized protein n=1 Tax=Gossypium arboreum TaxID=29729 RepID=A0ABR0NQ14_GOSAR|nr:hypothetical protein PVK06_031074 [Gossypium arboreum]
MNDERPQLRQDPLPSVHPQSALISFQDDNIQSMPTPQSSGNILDNLKPTRPTIALNDKASPITHPLVIRHCLGLPTHRSISSSPHQN